MVKKEGIMNGAEILVKTAIGAGIEVCFSNPGTTEMPFVNAMDKMPGMRAILGLFEGVCTGAADGYGRMLDKPAMALLHLGPGLANGISNLHNANRAGTPLLAVVGEHSTWHLPSDPPLTMDIESLARTFSPWWRTIGSARDISADTAEAVAAASKGQISTLIVPYDYQLAQAKEQPCSIPAIRHDLIEMEKIEIAAQLLGKGKKAALVLGGRALRRQGLMIAAGIASGTGCDLLAENFPSHMERGAGLPDVTRIPYLPEMAMDLLQKYEILVCAGAREPVAFFGYEGLPSRYLKDEQKLVHIVSDHQDVLEALSALAETLGSKHSTGAGQIAQENRPSIPEGDLTGEKICSVIAAFQPEGAIVVEEAITNSLMYYPLTAGVPPFSLLTLTGGSLGFGPPCAIGAAVACPKRPVINFQADGSAMYTLQALWTQAKEGLNVTTLICSNRSYDILKLELTRLGTFEPGKAAQILTDLKTIDWVKIGEGLGIPSTAVATSGELARSFKRALEEEGPHLIEMIL